MSADTPYHHGLVVRNSEQMAAALNVLGFEPIATDGATARMARLLGGDDAVRNGVALRHRGSGQRIDLFEPNGTAPGDGLRDGDITVGIPVSGDPAELYEQMRSAAPSLAFAPAEDAGRERGLRVAIEGHPLVLTQKKEPFTAVHYSPERWPEAERFYEDVLGFCYFPLPNRGDTVRTRIENAPVRVDLEAGPETQPATPETPRRSAYRLVNDKFDDALARLGESGAQWVREPENGRAELMGPLGERMELVDAKELST